MRNTIRLTSIFCLVVLCTLANTVQAQVDVIELNKLTMAPKKQIPFDQPFILKVPLDSKEQKVTEAIIYESFVDEKGNRTYINPKDRSKTGGRLETYKINQEKEFLYIYMKPLRPNTYFEIVLRNKLHGKRLSDLLDINESIDRGKLPEAAKAFQTWKDDLDGKSPYEELTITALGGFSWRSGPWKGYQKFYKDSLNQFYKSVNGISTISRVQLNKVNIRKIAQIGKAFNISTSELSQLQPILENESWERFMKGYIGLDTTVVSKKIGKYNFSKRIELLDKNITSFKLLVAFTDKLLLHINPSKSKMDKDGKPILSRRDSIELVKVELNQVLIKLRDNKKILDDSNNGIRKAIDKSSNLRYGTAFIIENRLSDLKTEAGVRVIPDFGVAYITAWGNDERVNYTRPYAGINISPRPINKQLKFRDLNRYDREFEKSENRIKSIWHRMSFSVGVTVSKLPDGEFEDLINNVSLLTGVNYRVYRGIYVSTGAVWLKQKNPNPIITDTEIEPAWYLGVSLDLDISNVLKPVTGLIF